MQEHESVLLHRRSFWRPGLLCESRLPGVDAYSFHHRGGELIVDKRGQTFARTDGDKHLAFCGQDFHAGREHFWQDCQWLASAGGTFRFHRDPADRGSRTARAGVRITLDHRPDEGYVAQERHPPFIITSNTRLMVTSLGRDTNLDHMVVLLAYFWQDARNRWHRAG